MSEGQRKCTIKNRVSGEQTGLGGAEPKGAGSWTQKPCMPLSRLGPLIYLTPTLQPDAACPAHLHTRTVHSFTNVCLAPASGQVVFQARDSHEETDNNPSPWGAETLPEARGTAPVAEPRPCPPQPPAGLLELWPWTRFRLSIPPPPRRHLSGLTARQPLPPHALCPSQHRPPSETASPTPASPQCTWRCHILGEGRSRLPSRPFC